MFYIDQEKSEQKYGLFIGSDILESLGIDLNYSTKSIQWGDSYAQMRENNKTALTNSDNEEMAAQLFNDEDDPIASTHTKDSAKRARKF